MGKIERDKLLATGQNHCSVCKSVKPVGEFYRNRKYRGGYLYKCRACVSLYNHSEKVRAQQREYQKSDKGKDKARRAYLRQKYDISLEDYTRMYEVQGGHCASCGDIYPKLAVDHCHTSQKIRELLCNACNSALGYLKDSPVRCDFAKAYLIKHS